MTINWAEVLAGVIIAAIVGAGGALWVRFSEAGRKFWQTLGIFEAGDPGPLVARLVRPRFYS